MKTVLLLTDVDFWFKSSGHRVRISSLVNYLCKNVRLTIVFTGPFDQRVDISSIIPTAVEFHILENKKYLSSTGYGRKLKTLLKDRSFNSIIIEYIHSSYFLHYLSLPDGTKIILDAHDIISERTKEFEKYNYKNTIYELPREKEHEIMSVYDYVMVLCEEDYDEVNFMTGLNNALLCPHSVETIAHPFNTQALSIAFVASSYLPNVDAINHFLATCWPSIVSRYNIHLDIYGSICNTLNKKELQNINLNGFQPDINSIYEKADIIINPVRFGAGVKIKNIEALAHGLPLVTTTHGARGLTKGKTNAFVIADTQDQVVGALSLLIENKQYRYDLSKKAHNFVKQNLTATACYSPLLFAINSD